MTTFKVMISAPYMLPFMDHYKPLLESHDLEVVVADVNERLEEEDLLPIIGQFDGAICGDDRFNARVVEAAKNLKVLVKWGTGIDSYDQEACAKAGIEIRNTPNAFSEPLGDTALGYMLCFCRNLVSMTEEMRAGRWQKINGRQLSECTIGIIGVGDVGKAILRRAAAFKPRLLGCDIKDVDPAFIEEVGLEIVDQETLLRESDFVSLNCDLNDSSFHLMNDDTFALMKKDAVLINLSRGPVVDEPALCRAIENGTIAGAALDVFEDEPLPEGSPLRGFKNVFLAPHNSNSSPKAWTNVHENSVRNLLDVLNKHR